jgi:hypothetical protein
MKIAIMQPYYYPYIGYFELIKSVDKFVFLNDVQYIRRGWINRNRIRWNNSWKYLTVPIIKCSQSTLIENVKICGKDWRNKHLMNLSYSYKEAYKHPAFQYLASFNITDNLCNLLMETIKHTSDLLNIKTEFLDSRDFPTERKKQYRIIDICKQIGAKVYINAAGGVNLYQKTDFNLEGISLIFLKPTTRENKLSILDLLLYDNIKEV